MLTTVALVLTLALGAAESALAVSTYSQAYAKDSNDPPTKSDRDPASGRDVDPTLSVTSAVADTKGSWAVANAYAQLSPSGVIKQTTKSSGYRTGTPSVYSFARASARGTTFFLVGPPGGSTMLDIVVPESTDPIASIHPSFDDSIEPSYNPFPNNLLADISPTALDPSVNDLILNMTAELSVNIGTPLSLNGSVEVNGLGLQDRGDLQGVFEPTVTQNRMQANVRLRRVLGSVQAQVGDRIDFLNDVYFTSSNNLGAGGGPIDVKDDGVPLTLPIGGEPDLSDVLSFPFGTSGSFTMILVPRDAGFSFTPEPSTSLLSVFAVLGLMVAVRRPRR